MVRSFTYFLLLVIGSCRSARPSPETLVNNFMKEGRVPGAFVAVVKGDSVLFQKSFGVSDLEKGTPMTANTCMELGSISKAFTAEAIYYLHQAGRMDLNESITRYSPGVPGSWAGITIRHLLSHTSGIRNYLQDPRFMAAEYFQNQKTPLAEEFFTEVSTDSMVWMFYDLPLEFSPGTSWSYSNTGYYLLGKIAENVLHRDFFDFVRDSVHLPLGMRQTMANELAAKKGCMSKGYFLKNGQMEPSRLLNSNYAFAAGAWATSGADMIQYIKAIHQRNLPSDHSGYDWRNAGKNIELPFSYEGGRFYSTFRGMKIISHQGGTPGFSSSWFYLVDKNVSIIILINRQDYAAVDPLAFDILKLYEPVLRDPVKKLRSEEVNGYTRKLLDVIKAVKIDGSFPEGLSAPLRVFMESENGRGFWKWFFERGFPDTAYGVESETIGDAKAFRFHLPLPGITEYHMTILLNSKNEITQIRGW
jgi:CubicO group peptidase (beta-lactamase class C family)